jgi:hypothetical protein
MWPNSNSATWANVAEKAGDITDMWYWIDTAVASHTLSMHLGELMQASRRFWESGDKGVL